jgi:putative ABC transport system permease protein
VTKEVERGFSGDFVVQSSGGSFGPPSGFPSSVADAAEAVEGVEVVVPLGFGRAEFTYPDGEKATQFLTSVEPERLSEVLDVRMEQGEVADLGDDGIILDVEFAKDHDVAIGDRMQVVVPGGRTLDLEVQAISDDENLLGYFTITRTTYAEVVPELLDFQVFGKLSPDADADATLAAVEDAVDDTPSLDVLDRDAFVGDLASQITSFVTVVYALLLLSIVIALIGIANTLSLSINERTRELGLLRAVGMHKAQMRSTVRWEAVLISLLGTLVGLTLGLLLSWALVTGLDSQGLTTFAVPIPALVVIAIGASLLGTMASILPARRAARLGILDAIATD